MNDVFKAGLESQPKLISKTEIVNLFKKLQMKTSKTKILKFALKIYFK